MIEGLRVLPWLQEAQRRKTPTGSSLAPDYLSNCDTCMQTQSVTVRKAIGCGYETAAGHPTGPWRPSSLKRDGDWSESLTTCPGYTTKLPEVIEIARARLHWKEGGGLRDFCDEPTDQLRQGVEILNGATNECHSWAIENPEKK